LRYASRWGSPIIHDSLRGEDNAFNEWCKIINKMIKAFELISKDQWEDIKYENNNHPEVKEGLDLFREYFFNLWD
jgi:hypothetical protein